MVLDEQGFVVRIVIYAPMRCATTNLSERFCRAPWIPEALLAR